MIQCITKDLYTRNLPRRPEPARLTKEQRNKILELYKSGMQLAEITPKYPRFGYDQVRNPIKVYLKKLRDEKSL